MATQKVLSPTQMRLLERIRRIGCVRFELDEQGDHFYFDSGRLIEIIDEQIADWQLRKVSICDAALSLGRLPPTSWAGLKSILAEEIFKAEIMVEKRDRLLQRK